MPSRPTWFWTSLLSSVAVNAVLATSSACWLYSETPVYLPGYARSDVMVPIFVEQPEQASIPDTTLGDSNGKGDAADAQAGEQMMEARQGPQGQAFLSRDPEGPGKIGQDPSMSTQIPGENGNGDDGAPMMFGAATPQQPQAQPAPSFARPQVQVAQNEPQKPDPAESYHDVGAPPARPQSETKSAGETPTPRVEQPEVAVASIAETPVTPQAIKSPPAPATPSESTGGGKPGPNVAPADPAPQSESESDPFSKKGAVQFKRGATDVQFGRKHKIIRPRLGLAGEADLLNLRDPITLVLALTLDDTGKVVRVDILKSSGSRNVDQACKVAAYQWWLEPSKDHNGKPVRDVVPFVIGFS